MPPKLKQVISRIAHRDYMGLKALAERNNRSLSAEVKIAVEFYLSNQYTYRQWESEKRILRDEA